ncbi:HAAS signaling domain-containing protein [Neobacillus niacini]|uniref:HAAS signaling domain-containing protein n=1 Tax=Neobacillus niacini TaxID=86668 RepID=UPI0039830594
MERPKNKFLELLEKGLGEHQDKKNILMEYEVHIDEILFESCDCSDEKELMERLISRLGNPEEIAAMWKEELSVTPSNMKWLFILMNIFFFGGGSLLTLFHNLFNWKWLSIIWSHLTAIPVLIAFIYMFFWALLGYEIGKGFGHGGKKLLRRTFLLSLIPNLLLMVLTVFEIIPHSWFEPLLTNTFIIACIILTIILYPISWLGYVWGKKVSV